MQTQLLLTIDSQTIELANSYAKAKGLSVNELIEESIRLIVLNEQILKHKTISVSTIFPKQEPNFGLKKTNWKELNTNLMQIRCGLPSDYKFDRELANDR